MRDSLRKSLADSPATNHERFPKGSVVLCNACSLPIFKLDYGIALGMKAGRAASAFKPLSLADLDTLAGRDDIDAGVRAKLKEWTLDQRVAHVGQLTEMHSGDPMLCPVCKDTFVQVLATERNEVLDKSFTIELLVIPPEGLGTPPPVRGKRLGANRDWVH